MSDVLERNLAAWTAYLNLLLQAAECVRLFGAAKVELPETLTIIVRGPDAVAREKYRSYYSAYYAANGVRIRARSLARYHAEKAARAAIVHTERESE